MRTGHAPLTDQLAVQVMGWGLAQDRYVLGQRRWLPRWRFQPLHRVEDAFRLLQKADPQQFTMQRNARGITQIKLCLNGKKGEARSSSTACAVTLAIARALALEASEGASER